LWFCGLELATTGSLDIGIGVYNALGVDSECHFGVTIGRQNVA